MYKKGFTLPPVKSKICSLAPLPFPLATAAWNGFGSAALFSTNPHSSHTPYGRLAFTLAEVLITLAVIGVVAALTIPSVVRNYQKTQAVTQLKKAYSTIANTTNLAVAEYGPVETWEMKDANEGGTGAGSVYFAQRYLIPYLKVSKDCENNR